jgi:hypothetical protein
VVECLEHEAGELGFRDFPGLLTAKENRTGSRQTLLLKWLFVEHNSDNSWANKSSSIANSHHSGSVGTSVGVSSLAWSSDRLRFVDCYA